MTAIRIIDSHLEFADIGSRTHAQIDTALDSLTDNSIADALHRHSELVASDGSPDPALCVDAAGNVGIGIAAPSYKLDTGNTTDTIRMGKVITGSWPFSSGYAFFGHASLNHAVAGNYSFMGSGDGQSYFNASTGKNIYFRINNVTKMILTSAGKVGIGTASPATSALLDLTSTTGALLLTRMTTVQKNALTAINGMLVYDSTLNKFQGYENGAWTSLI